MLNKPLYNKRALENGSSRQRIVWLRGESGPDQKKEKEEKRNNAIKLHCVMHNVKVSLKFGACFFYYFTFIFVVEFVRGHRGNYFMNISWNCPFHTFCLLLSADFDEVQRGFYSVGSVSLNISDDCKRVFIQKVRIQNYGPAGVIWSCVVPSLTLQTSPNICTEHCSLTVSLVNHCGAE